MENVTFQDGLPIKWGKDGFTFEIVRGERAAIYLSVNLLVYGGADKGRWLFEFVHDRARNLNHEGMISVFDSVKQRWTRSDGVVPEAVMAAYGKASVHVTNFISQTLTKEMIGLPDPFTGEASDNRKNRENVVWRDGYQTAWTFGRFNVAFNVELNVRSVQVDSVNVDVLVSRSDGQWRFCVTLDPAKRSYRSVKVEFSEFRDGNFSPTDSRPPNSVVAAFTDARDNVFGLVELTRKLQKQFGNPDQVQSTTRQRDMTRIAPEEQESMISSFWTMLQEIESVAQEKKDPVLKRWVGQWYEQWNRVTGDTKTPRYSENKVAPASEKTEQAIVLPNARNRHHLAGIRYVIYAPDEEDVISEDPLVWSNDLGWVGFDLGSPVHSTFSRAEMMSMTLPHSRHGQAQWMLEEDLINNVRWLSSGHMTREDFNAAMIFERVDPISIGVQSADYVDRVINTIGLELAYRGYKSVYGATHLQAADESNLDYVRRCGQQDFADADDDAAMYQEIADAIRNVQTGSADAPTG